MGKYQDWQQLETLMDILFFVEEKMGQTIQNLT
jgi:hypothetical protein